MAYVASWHAPQGTIVGAKNTIGWPVNIDNFQQQLKKNTTVGYYKPPFCAWPRGGSSKKEAKQRIVTGEPVVKPGSFETDGDEFHCHRMVYDFDAGKWKPNLVEKPATKFANKFDAARGVRQVDVDPATGVPRTVLVKQQIDDDCRTESTTLYLAQNMLTRTYGPEKRPAKLPDFGPNGYQRARFDMNSEGVFDVKRRTDPEYDAERTAYHQKMTALEESFGVFNVLTSQGESVVAGVTEGGPGSKVMVLPEIHGRPNQAYQDFMLKKEVLEAGASGPKGSYAQQRAARAHSLGVTKGQEKIDIEPFNPDASLLGGGMDCYDPVSKRTMKPKRRGSSVAAAIARKRMVDSIEWADPSRDYGRHVSKVPKHEDRHKSKADANEVPCWRRDFLEQHPRVKKGRRRGGKLEPATYLFARDPKDRKSTDMLVFQPNEMPMYFEA